jgi:hypothetical protein
MQGLQERRQDMAIDINSFGEKYNLEFETVQVGDHRVRLAVANSEPAFEDSREYTLITGNRLLCPLDGGEWALVTSATTTRFEAEDSAAAADHAKRIIVGNE